MPNHVTNVLHLTGTEFAAKKLIENHWNSERNHLDFDTIIPQPEILKHTCEGVRTFEINGKEQRFTEWWVPSQDLLNNGEKERPFTIEEKAELSRIGHYSWYTWSIENWGTKWNSYSGSMIDDRTLRFQTAWSPPEPVMIKLSAMFPSLRLMLSFVDEGWCYAGVQKYYRGEKASEVDIPCEENNNAFEVLYQLCYDRTIAEDRE